MGPIAIPGFRPWEWLALCLVRRWSHQLGAFYVKPSWIETWRSMSSRRAADLVPFPVLAVVYLRLVRREERDVLAEFVDACRIEKDRTPAFQTLLQNMALEKNQ